jgi:valacyclovir hydrolase
MWFEHGTSKIYYEEQGSGDPVLLLPGWSQFIDELTDLRKVISGAGYRVIAADLPGSGRSLPHPREYTTSYFDDDAASFAALLDHLGVGPYHLIGFSDGGDVTLLMALQSPRVARSVVTWGSAGLLSDPTGQLRQAMYNMIDNPIPPMRGFRDYLVAQYGEQNARAMTQSEANAIGAIIETRGGDLSLSKADQITCPALLIAGEHDMFVPPPLLTQLASRIPNSESHIVEGAGHAVNDDKPEWLASTILDWLSRH